MRFAAVFLFASLALCALTPYDHFNNFVVSHRKKYASAEERKYRFQVFQDNLKEAERLNALHDGATYGITRFSDLTPEEFVHSFLLRRTGKSYGYSNSTMLKGDSLPTSFDWRDYGAVTPVKNQGGCGSCWAFSATQNAEGVWAAAGNTLQKLAVQQVIDCTDDENCHGCEGGFAHLGQRGINAVGGIELESDYPYEEAQSTCRFNKKRIAATFSDQVDITPGDDTLMEFLHAHGPASMGVYANVKWQLYTGGIVTQTRCNASRYNHDVLVVAWGVENGAEYWTIKNTWDTTWGEEGYIRLARGDGCVSNDCHSLVA
jgi:cathepsin F